MVIGKSAFCVGFGGLRIHGIVIMGSLVHVISLPHQSNYSGQHVMLGLARSAVVRTRRLAELYDVIMYL